MDIPQEVFNLYNDFADDFISSNFGVTCTIVYPSKLELCPNCLVNPLTKTSSNQYKSGGPIPFDEGLCPYCNGEGFKDYNETLNLKLRVYFAKKDWIKVQVPVNANDSTIQTIGFASDLPNILKAEKLIVLPDGVKSYEYQLAGEPLPHGFKRNRYFVAFWNRIQ